MFDLDRIDAIRIGVLGDAAIDIHWFADMKLSELSRETPHYPLPVVREEITPGAAGNLAANIAALKPGRIEFCGVAGDDWRGGLLKKTFAERNIIADGLIVEAGRFTNAYCKPMRMGISDVIYEDPRIDFSTPAPISEESEEAIIGWLDRAEKCLDALCVCDQFVGGCVTKKVRDRLSGYGIPVFVDSRYNIERFRIKRGVLKPNEHECASALVRLGMEPSSDMAENGLRLAGITGSDILLTLGEKGALLISDGSVTPVKAVRVDGETDICGAGDTYLSAFACCAASGASYIEAARIAAAASAVTVKKIGVTGTASREEITGKLA